MGQSSSTEEDQEDRSDSASGRDECRLYGVKVSDNQWPIVYADEYNISFGGLERIHPFDSGKWGKIYKQLKESGLFKSDKETVRPLEANAKELSEVHTKEYLDSLGSSVTVATITEVPPVAILPNRLVQSLLLSKFRLQTGGTILAAKLAIERGWSINLGGGFHHCSSGEGGGFCAYADITLAIKFARKHFESVKKVMIVDFDAHQGNGHERDFIEDNTVYIMDMYNRWIYPGDTFARSAIKCRLELNNHTEDADYLDKIRSHLPARLDSFKPDLVVYNAGTDVLLGDPLGNLDITPDGVRDRDELVFQYTHERNIPVVMVTSGGYQRNNAEVIARSILNLNKKNLIPGPGIVSEADEATTHLAEVAGQMEKSASKKKKAKVKVRSAEGRGDEGGASKQDKAVVEDEDNPGDLVGGGATGVGSENLDGAANLTGNGDSVKRDEGGYWTPEEGNDSDQDGNSPVTAQVEAAASHQQ